MARRGRLIRLLGIPAPLLAAKLARRLSEAAAAPIQRSRDRSESTFGPPESERLGRLILGCTWIPTRPCRWAAETAESICTHRFSLLGSGPVQVQRGMSCTGFLGHAYPPVRAKMDPALEVPEGCRSESSRLRDMIEGSYQPIDWQIDFRSGYRWGSDIWHRDIRIGHQPGADIKVPWELGRLQHLPILALAFASAAEEERERFWREFRSQTLDFLSANPPRWGVQWRCPMDVGIRLANLLLARDLFLSAGAAWDDAFEAELARTARAHVRHIADHLEWFPGSTGNHYLADIVGLLFGAAYLPVGEECDQLLAFAVRQFVAEAQKQFLPDGGSYEASTGYHRLSAEMLLWGAAVILALPEAKHRALRQYRCTGWKRRPKLPPGPTPTFRLPGIGAPSLLPEALFHTLSRAAAFSKSIHKPNGLIVQIGDNDSGRFIKIEDPARPDLDHRLVLEIAQSMGTNAGGGSSEPGSQIVRSMTENAPMPVLMPETAEPCFKSIGLDDVLCAVEARAERSKEGRREVYEWVLGEGIWEGLEMQAFPDFGLYIFRSPRAFASIRCGRTDMDGRGGHAHSDALALELWADGRDLVRDPGSFVYTADTSLRNVYRSSRAHFVPWVEGREPNPLDVGTFLLPDRCRSATAAFCETGFAGRHGGYGETVWRVVRLAADRLTVTDFFEGDGPNRLCRAPLENGVFRGAVPFSRRYGEAEESQ